MRKLLLILTVLLAALPSRAQTDTLTLGYCKGQIAAKGRTTAQGKKWISGAIRLTSVTLSPFVDNKIVGVRVGLCSRVNIDTLQVWVRTTATGENLAEGIITARDQPRIAKGWNSVMLNVPIDISTGDEFFVGFSYKQRGSTSAISVVGNATRNACYLDENGTGKWYDRYKYGCLSVEAVVAGDNLPKYDLALSAPVGIYNPKTGKLNMTAKVYNNATRQVEGFTIQTQISGMEQPSINHISQCVKPGESMEISYETMPDATTIDGSNLITATISSLDDYDDNDKSNNQASTPIAFKQNLLIEEFTTENCPNCPRVAGYLRDVLDLDKYQGQVFAAAHHEMYYDDWLTLQQSVVDGTLTPTDIYSYAMLYNDKGTYAPALMYNRQPWFTSNTGNDTPVALPSSSAEIQSLLDYALALPANAAITSLTARYGDNDTTVVVSVEGICSGAASQGLNITVMLTEDNIDAHNQAGYGEGFVHQHVSRALNNVWGVPVTMNGNRFSYQVAMGLNSHYFKKIRTGSWDEAYRNWKKDNIHIIAFVNTKSSSPTGCGILNVESIDFSAVTGIAHPAATGTGSGVARKDLYNLNGTKAEASPAPGVYIERTVYSDGHTTSRKIIK